MSAVPYEIIVSYIEGIKAEKIAKLKASGDDAIKICCPFHNDKDPSGVIKISTGKFGCNATTCSRKTDVVSVLAAITSLKTGQGISREGVLDRLIRDYGMTPVDEAPLASEPILLAHKELLDNLECTLAKSFLAKGVDLQSIKKYKIGIREGRIIMPILNEYGTHWINERKYLPNASGADKMRNCTGRNKPMLYPVDQLSFPSICICGGETKALVAAQALNQHDIGAVCVTGAEGVWNTNWNKFLSGKKVYVIMDVDGAGRKAAQKIARLAYKPAEEVLILTLMLDEEKYPKGDINNFVYDEKQDLYAAIQSMAVSYIPRLSGTEGLDEGEYTNRSISEAIDATKVGTRSAVDCTVIGVSEQRYSLPKTVKVSCNFDDKGCHTCSVYGKQKNPRFSIPVEHPALIAMCNAPDAALESTLRRGILGIPTSCKHNMIVVEQRYGAEIVVVSQPVGLEHTTSEDARHVQKALVACDGVELNSTVRLFARAQPDPRTQETVLVTGQVEKLLDSLDDEDTAGYSGLNIFQPKEGTLESLEDKLEEIATDLSCNVTSIYQRNDMHRVIDIVAHSPLAMKLEDNTYKGYIEALIIGDTGQGKSECTKLLSRHYGVGHIVDCANVSVAGLVGGNQQLAGMWVTTWGALPTNDRKWVIFEEVKRAPVEVLAALTETRSSGIARINKIKAGSRPARTRLLWTSNTRSDRFLRTYGSGVDAVLELIGQPEDVRRLDLCYAVSADDIDGDVIHSKTRPAARHVFTSALCHRLLAWVWTRKPAQVAFTPTVKDLLFAKAQQLSSDYVDTVPIIDRGTIRLKLARIAASIACRTYSTEDGENVCIQERHIECAYNFLKKIYDGDALGYKRYSDRHKATAHMSEAKANKVIKCISTQPYAETVADYLSTRTFINEKELAMLGVMTPEDCKSLLGVLLRNSGIEYKGNNVIITGALRETLRNVPAGTFKNGEGEY